MVKVSAKRASAPRATRRELYATVCYYYPRYSLQEAQKLPARDLNLLIKTAKKMEAVKMFNLTQIAAAPNSKKGKGVSKLLDHFKKEARS